MVKDKSFLRKIYEEWYGFLSSTLPTMSGDVLELGSGQGFCKDCVPEVITSDVARTPYIDIVADAQCLPYGDNTLRAIIMTNVFHHIRIPGYFLSEAQRCLRPGGVVAMVEPWNTPWSSWVYRTFHHEPFVPKAGGWLGVNNALPWIIFHRDRARFNGQFPMLRIESIEPFMPIRYLLSGGVSMPSLMPGWTFGFWRRMEQIASPYMKYLGMFAKIVLRKEGK